MALRTTNIEQANCAIWVANTNSLATDVGDLADLTTDVTTSIVNALNDLQGQINSVVVDAIALPNNTYFTADANGGGSVNLIKANTLNKIEFGTAIQNINIESGTIALSTPLGTASGGTGSSTVPGARTALGLEIGANVQAWDANLDQIAAAAPGANDMLVYISSAWTSQTPAQVKTALGLTVGTNVQAWDANLDQIAALTPTNDTFMVGTGAAWINRDAATTRSILGLVIGGSVQAWDANLDQIAALSPAASNFIVGNGSAWVGQSAEATRGSLSVRVVGDAGGAQVQPYSANLLAIAALAPTANNIIVGNGSAWVQNTASQARTSLGLAIGTDVQAFSTYLSAIAAMAVTTGNMIVANGTTLAAQTPAQVRTSLGLVVGTNVQAWDQTLDQIAAMTPTANNFIVGSGGTAWVLADPATARTAMGAQASSAALTAIAALSLLAGNIAVTNGSTWVAQSGAAARSTLGAAALGVNNDITSLTACTAVTPAAEMFIGPSTNTNLIFTVNAANRLILNTTTLYPNTTNAITLGGTSNRFLKAWTTDIDMSGDMVVGSGSRIKASVDARRMYICGGTDENIANGSYIEVQGNNFAATGGAIFIQSRDGLRLGGNIIGNQAFGYAFDTHTSMVSTSAGKAFSHAIACEINGVTRYLMFAS